MRTTKSQNRSVESGEENNQLMLVLERRQFVQCTVVLQLLCCAHSYILTSKSGNLWIVLQQFWILILVIALVLQMLMYEVYSPKSHIMYLDGIILSILCSKIEIKREQSSLNFYVAANLCITIYWDEWIYCSSFFIGLCINLCCSS